jgi:uncharacterized protein (TIGR00156 family)
MKTKFFAIALMLMFGMLTKAQENTKPVVLNIEKVLANNEKVVNENILVQLKGSFTSKTDDNNYIFKDETGEIKVYVNNELKNKVSELENNEIVYIIGKLNNNRENIFELQHIKKP